MSSTAARKENGMWSQHVFVVWLVAVFLCCSMTGAAAEPDVEDQTISDAIENEFIFDHAVNVNDIDVSVVDGIVTLSGTVDNILSKERAAAIAGTVKGVRSVVDLVDVVPPVERMDSEIESDAQNALLFNSATESYEVGVDVDDNVATLSGTVDSWQEKQLCEKVVMGVMGIKEVRNDIDIMYHAERADSEIRAEIEERLKWDVLVDHYLIDVSVEDGEVELSGTVGSLAEKRTATNDAWVGGVKAVDDSDLEVRMWARDERLRKDKYVLKPDDEIREAVMDALVYDPRVYSTEIVTDVDDGVVTLRGTVDNLDAKRAAEQAAMNTVGVVTVENRIKVRPMEYTDVEIGNRVRIALAMEPFVDRYDISVTVIGGIVYLDGTVENYFEKGRADDVAARTTGVEGVINNLKVEDTAAPLAYDPYTYDYNFYGYDWYDYEPYMSFKSDREIRDDIRDELFWSPFVDSDDVKVTVDDGVATLTGEVDTWSEYRAAMENAYEGGAVWVDNDLLVE